MIVNGTVGNKRRLRSLFVPLMRSCLLTAVVATLGACASFPDPKVEVAALGTLSKPELHVAVDPFFARETVNQATVTVSQGNNTVAQKADPAPGGIFIGSLLFLDLNSNVSLDFSPWITDSGRYSFQRISVSGGPSYTAKAPGTWKVDGAWTEKLVTIKGGTVVLPSDMGSSVTTATENKVVNQASSFTLEDSQVIKTVPTGGILNGLFDGGRGRPTTYDWTDGPLTIENVVFYVTPTKIVVHSRGNGLEDSVGVLEVSENKAVWTPKNGSSEVFAKVGQAITKNGQPFITWE